VSNLSCIEVTDPPVSDHEAIALVVRLLDSVFERFPVLAMSQMRWDTQGDKHSPAWYAGRLGEEFGIKAVVTRGLDDARELSGEETEFAVHVSGPPALEWLRELIWFGDWSLPNIAYATHHQLEPWPDKVIERNAKFVSWFWKRASDEVLRTVVGPSDMLFWIEDGDPGFAFLDTSIGEQIETKTRELAKQFGLEPVFGEARIEPGCLQHMLRAVLLLPIVPLALLSQSKRLRAMLRSIGIYVTGGNSSKRPD